MDTSKHMVSIPLAEYNELMKVKDLADLKEINLNDPENMEIKRAIIGKMHAAMQESPYRMVHTDLSSMPFDNVKLFIQIKSR